MAKLVLKKALGDAGSKLYLMGAVRSEYAEALEKGGKVEDEDGVLTQLGMSVAAQYARSWVEGERNVKLEREYPDLAGLFYDIRVDSSLARRHAS